MQFQFLSIFIVYQIISPITAEESDEARTSEDNYALRGLPSETKLTNRTKRSDVSDYDNFAYGAGNVAYAGTVKTPRIKAEDREYEAEKKQGDMADLFGTNQHHSYPEIYKDLSRRFVPQYPYMEVMGKKELAEINLDNIAKEYKNSAKKNLIPIRAPPEIVLAVAAKSALLEAAIPHNRLEEKRRNKEILRSGNYWNSVWREDVDPDILRTQKENKIESVKVQVMPGSELYNLVTDLKKISPRLVYVMNKKQLD